VHGTGELARHGNFSSFRLKSVQDRLKGVQDRLKSVQEAITPFVPLYPGVAACFAMALPAAGPRGRGRADRIVGTGCARPTAGGAAGGLSGGAVLL